ncbi:MAG TPA: hypothetical protein VE569_12360 [Acidimicrobiia bacterium]|nr:hypothetical protein [Acidimicrobiia bacterium]
MPRHKDRVFALSWSLLAMTSVAILVFGIITTIWPGSDNTGYVRAVGVASVGMGGFGLMITLIPFRRRERWAWVTLWYLPIFWLAHFVGNLPPGTDHVHQIVFIVFSVVGLLIPIGAFFAPQTGSASQESSKDVSLDEPRRSGR